MENLSESLKDPAQCCPHCMPLLLELHNRDLTQFLEIQRQNFVINTLLFQSELKGLTDDHHKRSKTSSKYRVQPVKARTGVNTFLKASTEATQSLSPYKARVGTAFLPTHVSVEGKPEKVRLSVKEDFARELKDLTETHQRRKSSVGGDSVPQYKGFAMKKAGILNSSKQFSGNPLLFSNSNQTHKFSPLKESDLAGNSPMVANCPVIPSVSPVLEPLIPALSGVTEKQSKRSSVRTTRSGLMRVQDLDKSGVNRSFTCGKNVRGVVSKSTEALNQHNYYGKYSASIEGNGFFTNKWFIPVQKNGEKFISPEGHEFELYKSYSAPLHVSEEGKAVQGIVVYSTVIAARNEIEGTSTENKGFLRVHVCGSYIRLKLCKFVFNCITPIEFLSL